MEKMNNKLSIIKVNDIFDELKEENKRLENELFFANKCVIILSKFKLILDVICVRFESQIDSKQTQELINLRKEYKQVLTQNKIINNNKKFMKTNEDLNESVIQKRSFDKTFAINDKKKSLICDPNRVESKPPSVVKKPKTENESKIVEFVCDWIGCDFKTNNNKRFIAHKTSHLLFKNDAKRRQQHKNCGQQLSSDCNSNEGIDVKESEKTDNTLRCDWIGCDFKCHSLSVLSAHKNFHTGDRPAKCPISGCGKAFVGRKQLQIHVKLVHIMVDKNFVCDRNGCNKRFKNRIILNAHLKIHDNHKRFVCDFPDCDFKTIRKASLDSHRSKHFPRTEKTHKCHFDGCKKSFRYRNSLNRHLMTHDLNLETKCDFPECNLQFKNYNCLQRHKKYEHWSQELVCEWDDCEYKTNSYYAYRSHMNNKHCVKIGVIRPKVQQ